jgi:hypothetical protein
MMITTEIIAISTTVCPLSSTDGISRIASETKHLDSAGGLSTPTTSKTPLVTVTGCPGGMPHCHESSKATETLYSATVESEQDPSTHVARVSSHEWDTDSTRSAMPIQPADSKVYASIPTGEPPRFSTGALQSSAPEHDGSSRRPNGGQQPTNDGSGSAKSSTPHTKDMTVQPSGESTLRISGTGTGATTGPGSTQLETSQGPTAVSNSAHRQRFNIFMVGATCILSVFNLI